MFRKFPLLLLAAAVVSLGTAEEYNIDNEIVQANRELKRLKADREKVAKDAAEDLTEYTAYRKRTKQKTDAMIQETDSLKKATVSYQMKSDSLGGKLAGLNARQQELNARQKNLTEQLRNLCDEAIAAIRLTPPMLSKKGVSSLEFLKSELAAGSVDNIEGIYRLVQVVNDIEVQLADIQIGEISSPVPEITGSVYQLRIGGVFEAFVDPKGEKGAIWSGGNPGEWVSITDPAVAAKILKAVTVREGKSLPAFIDIPFSSTEKGGAE